MGPSGPISLILTALLLAVAPLIRGGNRSIALIALEIIAILVVLLLVYQRLLTDRSGNSPFVRLPWLLWPLLLSPVLFTLLHLWPIPFAHWLTLPGRDVYALTIEAAGATAPSYLPVSISADATRVSLFAAIPVVALLLAGLTLPLSQIKRLLLLLIGGGLLQAMMGYLQVAAGPTSYWYFGQSGGDAIGTFASRNNYANYLAMILPVALFFAGQKNDLSSSFTRSKNRIGSRPALLWWIALCLVFIGALFLSRSRTGLVTGLMVAITAVALLYVTSNRSQGVRFVIGISMLIAAGGIVLFGLDAVMVRFASENIRNDAGFRGLLAESSLTAAWAYWPWGSGLGTYESAYARFQPPSVAGYAEHAHNDYVQLLLEGGALAAALILVGFALFVRQLLALTSALRSEVGDDAAALLCLLCGLGLFALLLHSFVDYHMRIPANAMTAAFLAGVFLRPCRLPTASQGAR